MGNEGDVRKYRKKLFLKRKQYFKDVLCCSLIVLGSLNQKSVSLFSFLFFLTVYHRVSLTVPFNNQNA